MTATVNYTNFLFLQFISSFHLQNFILTTFPKIVIELNRAGSYESTRVSIELTLGIQRIRKLVHIGITLYLKKINFHRFALLNQAQEFYI